MAEEERRLAAIMFTDIVGYTALMGENEALALRLLEKNRKIQVPLIEMYHGQFLKEMGDGILASFTTASDAVHCAQEILRISKEEPELKIHIGIHLGEVIFSKGDVFGDGVNIASRIDSIATEGEIFISETVYQNIKNKGDIHAEFVEKHRFKNVKEPVSIYRLKKDAVISDEVLPTEKPKRKTLSSKQIGVTATIVAVFFITYFLLSEYLLKSSSRHTYLQDKTIAVIPFWNDSPDTENDYFCRGMEEEIRIQLLQIEDLKIMSRQSVEKYRENPEKDLLEIGSELDVSYIVEGSVRKLGKDIRVTVQLIDAKKGDHIWGDTYDGDYTEALLKFQSNTAKLISTSLNVEISSKNETQIGQLATTDIAAYDFYLRGQYELSNYWNTVNYLNLEKAQYFLDKSLKTDPDFLSAIHAKGSACVAARKYDSALYYANKAVAMDPEDFRGYGIKGECYAFMQETDLAIENLLKTIRMAKGEEALWYYVVLGRIYNESKNDPVAGLQYAAKGITLPEAHLPAVFHTIAKCFTNMGDYTKAEDYHLKAFKSNFSCLGLIFYSRALLFNSKTAEMQHFLDSACNPQICQSACNWCQFNIHVVQHDFNLAELSYQIYAAEGLLPISTDSINMAYVLMKTGKQDEASLLINSLRNSMEKKLASREKQMAAFILAQVHAIQGEHEIALSYFSDAFAFGVLMAFYDYAKVYPTFENLWSVPEFQELLRQGDEKKTALRNQVRHMIERGELKL